jgi:hypothetical protein
MYIDLNTGKFEYDDGYCEGGYCEEVTAASETSGAAMRKKKRAFSTKGKEDSKLLATDGEWELYTPESWESAVYLGSLYSDEKARWATSNYSDSHWFDHYNKYGPLYIFVNKSTGEKYQSCPATGSWFFDTYDRNLGEQALCDFLNEHPNFIIDDFAEVLDECDDDVEACGDINASTEIDASKMPARYQSVRDVLGEDEWYYIEEYLMNGDGEYSLDDILYDLDAWDHYADWKMKTYGKKPAIAASTRIRARRYLR